jgi:hypothetical protein
MNGDSMGPAMSQKIFSLNLGVETVSLYLLCCAIADTGRAITRETLLEKWNGSRPDLDRELRRLEERNILGRNETAAGKDTIYQLADERQWR